MVSIKSHSGIYTLTAHQQLNMDMESAWDFFSSPNNLAEITPAKLGFEITSGNTARMYAGQIISYNVSPLLGIKMHWVTEITKVEDYKYFVDEQRFGPYAMWHHEHHFEEKDGGVFMTDKISYKLPVGALGRLFHPLLVEPQLKEIFEYRFVKLEELFNKKSVFQAV